MAMFQKLILVGFPQYSDTVKVNIFACINFREFAKKGNLGLIYICISDIIVSI